MMRVRAMTLSRSRYRGLTSLALLAGRLTIGLLVAGTGCKDVMQNPGLPAGTPDPDSYNDANGAVGLRNAAIVYVRTATERYLIDAGFLSDELQDRNTGASAGILLQTGGVISNPLDERLLPEGSSSFGAAGATSYAFLQSVRGSANIARAALATYDTAAARRPAQQVLRGELYALEAYAEILLAELFCSGVPLSTLDFHGDFTYHPSSTTAQVYQDALAKLDSALVLAAASDSVVNLARVLQGRAHLGLGQYQTAAAAVSTVPPTFRYRMILSQNIFPVAGGGSGGGGTVSDREGENGLPFRSSGDPRTATVVTCTAPTFGCPSITLTRPAKYTVNVGSSATYTPFVLASGVEARLIEAEAALQAGDPSWVTILNTLRTDGTVTRTYTRLCRNGIAAGSPGAQTGSPCPAGVVDTTWGPGTGIDLIPASVLADIVPVCPRTSGTGTPCTDTVWYKGLQRLTDPGSDAARVTMLFQERAYWLFLNGHRQGDLRRLLRQYSQYTPFQSERLVYPTGAYTAPGTGRYGTDVNAPVPLTEYANPQYHGCINRNP